MKPIFELFLRNFRKVLSDHLVLIRFFNYKNVRAADSRGKPVKFLVKKWSSADWQSFASFDWKEQIFEVILKVLLKGNSRNEEVSCEILAVDWGFHKYFGKWN